MYWSCICPGVENWLFLHAGCPGLEHWLFHHVYVLDWSTGCSFMLDVLGWNTSCFFMCMSWAGALVVPSCWIYILGTGCNYMLDKPIDQIYILGCTYFSLLIFPHEVITDYCKSKRNEKSIDMHYMSSTASYFHSYCYCMIGNMSLLYSYIISSVFQKCYKQQTINSPLTAHNAMII